MQSFQATDLPENPRQRANIVSKLCFWYTFPTLLKGRKKTLDYKDLYQALDEHKSETLGNAICNSWEKELKSKKGENKKPSLLVATMRVFRCKLALLGLVLFLLELGLRPLQPIFLLGLISYYSNAGENVNKAYYYAGAVIIISAFNVIIIHPYMLATMHVGMKMRVAMCSMIYRKALRLSKNALDNTTAGEVLNLLSNDVGRLDMAAFFLHFLWIGPLETLFITYLMYREIDIAAIFGVAFMLLFIPLQIWLGKKTSVLRLRTALRTDERVRRMNEIIVGIQVIKMYAWEIPFAKMVAFARKKEIKTIRQVSYIRGILLSFVMFLTRISIFLSLIGYVLLQQILTPEKAFVITAYYNILRTTMTDFFPLGVSQLAETFVSIKRIEKYMLYDETLVRDKSLDICAARNYHGHIKSTIVKGVSMDLEPLELPENFLTNGNVTPIKAGIIMNNVKAKWDEKSKEYTLNNINLRVQPGTLVAIIGPIGAGKSSLIQSILGELRPESGDIQVKGTFSYASQQPWLFSGTVRQNILFGAEMNRRRYQTVIKKCALERDFELLPFGDKTIVGERGASLSGGQKARISLARAVYRETSIYLLDDPLSAVDIHVGRHLFEQCMRGLLRKHIVILVTHQLQFLQHADHIIIMDKGSVSAVGSYDALRESGLNFAQFLADSSDENIDERITPYINSHLKQRKNSVISVNSVAESLYEEMPSQNKEMQEEGKICVSLYMKYFKAGGGFFMLLVMIIFCILTQCLASGGDYFLLHWVTKYGALLASGKDYFMSSWVTKDNEVESFNATKGADSLLEASFLRYRYTQFLRKRSNGVYDEMLEIYIFTGIIIGTVIITLSRSFLFLNIAMRASINLHNSMFRGITRATMFFFNANPSGRILNRFSKDMGQVDESLPALMMEVIQIFLSLFGIIAVIAVVNPYFLLPTLILAVIFYHLRTFYLKTSRDVKRLEAITRSPIYSHMTATLTGLATIRSFGAQDVLTQEFDNFQDMHSSPFYMFLCISRAFGYWLDWLCVLYIAIITLSFFIYDPANGGAVGLAITQAMGMADMVQYGMRQSAALENTMTAVERIAEYDVIETEGELESKPNKKPPQDWPEKGNIQFEDLSLRYNPDPNSDYVLNSLNLVIKSCEKVGIVGRTGAGKSSLINALFRLSYNDGSVIIDSRDTKDLGLHDLRRKISIIPQEPVLFSGTMRYNLDPFDEYSDAKLWESLEEVKLKKVVAELPSGLQSKISEGGSNFSVGQRQLVCLARAILRENKILVMDEATANVDPQTDALIQTTIRNKFKNCTVLTIAHRLHTVMDSDKVLVMDAGRVVEFGSPYELLLRENVFYGMAKQTGKATFENLLKTAQKGTFSNN